MFMNLQAKHFKFKIISTLSIIAVMVIVSYLPSYADHDVEHIAEKGGLTALEQRVWDCENGINGACPGTVGPEGPQGLPGVDGIDGAVGLQGPPGMDGVDGVQLKVVDSLGQVLGPAIFAVNKSNVWVIMKIGGITTIVLVSPTEIKGRKNPSLPGVYFKSFDCSGATYFRPGNLIGDPVPNSVFVGRSISDTLNIYIHNLNPSKFFTANSWIDLNIDPTVCNNFFGPDDYVETLKFPLSIFDVFVPPFSVVGMPSLP